MRLSRQLGIGGLLALLLAGCSSQESTPTAAPETQREIAQGPLVGFSQAGAHVWRGVPFAKPPVGDLRWRAPRKPEPWRGRFEALRFGAVCPQFDFSGEPTGDEDCLTLNIYAPADARAEEGPLPTMLFVHGGGNSIGDAKIYDASRLASENRLVVVVVQYRLGVFGWLSHGALREQAAGAEDASGNFATLDLIRSLEWVRDNIASFGGDPERVTIFGESAGGVNVYSLLLSPRAKGLFHGAIAQSGFVVSFSPAEAENATDDPDVAGVEGSSTELLLTLLEQDDRADDRESAKALLASMPSEEIRALLRGKTSPEILEAIGSASTKLGGMYFAPFVLRDGSVIVDREPLEALASGHYNRVPVIVGTNRDEHRLFQAFSSPHVAHLGAMPLRIRDEHRYYLVTDYGSKLWKAGGADEPATAMSANQSRVFGYRFDWDEEPKILWLDLAELIGAGHAIELLFVFGGTNTKIADRMLLDDVPSAAELSRQMRSYWTQFAATGDPARGQQGDLPRWPAWASPGSGEGARYMVFDSPRDEGLYTSNATLTSRQVIDAVADDPRIENDEDRCEIYASFVQWSARMSPEEYESVAGGICQSYPVTRFAPGG